MPPPRARPVAHHAHLPQPLRTARAARAVKGRDLWQRCWPLLAVLGSVTALGFGTSLAKRWLFPALGAQGTSALRVGFAALILLCLWRPWRWPLRRAQVLALLRFGMALGGMNLLFYMALSRVPFGLAVAIEFSGPLAVALWHARRPLDFVWVLLALLGLALLLPLGSLSGSGPDPWGAACAAAAGGCWAAYIVWGQKLGPVPGGQAVSLGLTVAALLILPFGVFSAGAALLRPDLLLAGLVVAAISSALPYSLEMLALRRLPPASFGIALASEPAVAALMGMVLLQEWLSSGQWLAIVCIMAAAMGSAASRPAGKAVA